MKNILVVTHERAGTHLVINLMPNFTFKNKYEYVWLDALLA